MDYYTEGAAAALTAVRSKGGAAGAEHAADLRSIMAQDDRDEFIQGYNDVLDEFEAADAKPNADEED